MRGYDATSYGEAFADVYDAWYHGVSDVDATVRLIAELGGSSGRVLELGVGTGRLALPMAATGLCVTGIDASDAMLDRLRRGDPHGAITVVLGDMLGGLPPGPFDVVLVAYNTLFNLTGEGQQARCVANAAETLAPGGRLVVEAFVPDVPFRDGSDVGVRSMSADQVVLAVTRYDAAEQQAAGQFVEFSESGGVRLRPWFIRYSTTEQLDAMAAAASLVLEHRWEDVAMTPFDDHSDRHVSVYRRPVDG
jgi:SAM-dependent methyltransferase